MLRKTHFLFEKVHRFEPSIEITTLLNLIKYGNIVLDETSERQPQKLQDKSDFANVLGKAWEWTRKKYTSKVEGILLYFSRLMRPIWNKSLVNTYAFNFFVNEPVENFKRDEIQAFTRRVNEFKFWLENETKVIYCNELKNSSSPNLTTTSAANMYMTSNPSRINVPFSCVSLLILLILFLQGNSIKY